MIYYSTQGFPPIRQSVGPAITVVRVLLFLVAIAGVGSALVLARRYRKQQAGARIEKQGETVSAVHGGWAVFILLAAMAGIAEPFLACRLFLRAYLIRAWCLRGSFRPKARTAPAEAPGSPSRNDL